ncbi:MAG: glycerol-3-phosphate 1-O-acyltransferase PlsY [Gammaproteobacteria bacterium]
MDTAITIVLVIAAYLLGSVSSAIVVCRFMGLADPRTLGSGNPGATNVLRTGSKKAAAVTLIGDLLKGLLPVLAARYLQLGDPAVGAVGLATFCGHVYPLYYGFKGGKGVATAFGVLIALDWGVALLGAATWLAVAAITRISSLAALASSLLAPVYVYWLTHSPALAIFTGVIAIVICWRHRGNIRNLLRGTESRIGKGA